MIQDHSKRKTIIRSSIVFILVISIFLSSICVSLAINIPLPQQPVPFDYVVTNQDARDFAASILDNDPNGNFIVIQAANADYWWQNFQAILYISADTPVYCSSTSIWLGSKTGIAGWWVERWNTNQELSYSWTPSFTNNSRPVDDVTYYELSLNYTFINNNVNAFYCSCDFKDPGGDVSKNLDISDYLPNPYYLNAVLSEDKEFIWVDVNFNVDVFPSMVSLWGYNDYGATPYNYVRDEYIGVQFDMGTDGIHSIFKIPLAPFRAQYLGQDFTIQSISVIGWDEVGHEEWLSLGWHLSDLTPGEYNPPTNNYYNNYVYNSDYYTNLDRSVVSFGNVKIRLYSSNILGNVFWDEQKTTVTPFKYSYIFFPQLNYYDESYYDLINQLCLEFDLVFINCPAALVDTMYGSGTTQYINQIAHQNSVILEYITTLNRNYGRLPYGENPPFENYTEYICCCLYTDSFYLKNLAYFFGDNNNLLLELETRLFQEDGEFDILFQNMKNIYDNDFDYYSKMITYMDKLNYLVYVVTNLNYFENVIKYLKTISEKDFTIDLPEFDFSTVLGKYPDSNLSNLTDFISHSVSDLPTWDFSSLSTFTDAIGGLFTSVAPDGQFIENISNPYSFGDSVEDDLFPDNE